jgi:hypothetical protein
MSLTALHDATLVSLSVEWATNTLRIDLRTGDCVSPRRTLIVRGLRKLTCEHEQPWGPSNSVNEVRGPTEVVHGGSMRLEIELQSGDSIVVEAESFETAAIEEDHR